MPEISGRAYAKVNFGLRILDKRSDGFHELRTVFQTISLFDRIQLSWAASREVGISLSCNRKHLDTPNNLVVRAAEALLQATGKKGRLKITLEKRIPSGAGLGGGSTDAGATLVGLCRLFKKPPPREMLAEIAAELGSDIPFFLQGGRAVGVGRGEEVYPLPELPKQWLLVLAPNLHSSTPEAYRDLASARADGLTVTAKRRTINVFGSGTAVLGVRAAPSLAGALANDFEAVIFHRFPYLGILKSNLEELDACGSALSGSGSALFGLFASREVAENARRRLGKIDGDVFVVSTVTRKVCAAAWR